MSTRHEHKSVFTADNKQFKQKTKEVESRTNKLKNTLMKFGGAVAAAFSVQKILKFASESLKAFDKQIQAEKRLEAAVRANGEAVQGTMIEYKRWASQMQEISTVGDETTLDMLAVAQSMGVTGDAAKTAVKEAIALAKAMGMNEKSAIRYTAALQSGNSTMLARYLPTLRELDGEAERTAKAHELLGNMFSQVTEEAKQGLGPIKQLGNTFGDVKEKIGELIVNTDAWKGSVELLQKRVKELDRQLDDLTEVKTSEFIEENTTWFEKLSLKLGRFTKVGKEAISEMAEISRKQKEMAARTEESEVKTVEQYETIDSLNERLKTLKDELNNIDVTNKQAIATKVKDINATQGQIDALQSFIDKLGETENVLEKIKLPEGVHSLAMNATVDMGIAGIDTSQLDPGMSNMAPDSSIVEGLTAIEEAALAMGDAMVQSSDQGISSLKDYAKVALGTAKKIIAAKIAEGVAGAVSNALKDVPFPFNLVAAGVAGGAAAALFNAAIPNFAAGGAVSGPTLALVGEAAGISASNPEYIGTAKQLSQMGQGGRGGMLTARVSRGDLLFILNEGESYNKRSF